MSTQEISTSVLERTLILVPNGVQIDFGIPPIKPGGSVTYKGPDGQTLRLFWENDNNPFQGQPQIVVLNSPVKINPSSSGKYRFGLKNGSYPYQLEVSSSNSLDSGVYRLHPTLTGSSLAVEIHVPSNQDVVFVEEGFKAEVTVSFYSGNSVETAKLHEKVTQLAVSSVANGSPVIVRAHVDKAHTAQEMTGGESADIILDPPLIPPSGE